MMYGHHSNQYHATTASSSKRTAAAAPAAAATKSKGISVVHNMCDFGLLQACTLPDESMRGLRQACQVSPCDAIHTCPERLFDQRTMQVLQQACHGQRTALANLPDGFDYALGNVVDHVVTRTVRDSAAMLDATGWPEPGSPYPAPPKDRHYIEEVGRSPGRLRIAWSSETPSGRPIDPEIQAALERTAALLAGLGHEVFERGLGIDYRALFASRGPAAGANFAAGMQRMIELVGREPEPDELEPLTWALLKGGRRQEGAAVMRSLQDTRMLNRKTLAAFEDIDVYLCPVLGTPVPEIGFIDPVNLEPREVNRRQGRTFPYTPPFNFSGQPSLSLPLEMDAAGLPIGMMFTAKFADEATLFRLAAQLEKEAPWKDRRPRVWG